jgi:16S rRNA (adenine1518-N6/adenine1519-N6)-dimethyltransferase
MNPKKGSFRQLENPELFQKVVKLAFSQRRKKLKNNLRCFSFDQNSLKAISQESGIDLEMRGEMLSIEEFISLTRSIDRITKQKD